MPEASGPTTYWDYIRVRELLQLQGGLDGDDRNLAQDEVVFITVHQVYELWFKIALRDLETARDLFQQEVVPDDRLAGACRLLERLRIIFQLATDHFPLIETLTTRDYLEFRDKLLPANGGQSVQFRELEILIGLEDSERVPYVTGGSYEDVLRDPRSSSDWVLQRLAARRGNRPSFKEAVESWLYRTPIHGSSPGDEGDDATVDRFVADYLRAHRRALAELGEHAAASMPESEREEVRARYEGEAAAAARFLRADDAADEFRRRRRIRAGALFIEIYRELPLLAWPRQVLDLIVAVEQAFVFYRQRHARMAERIIGKRVGTGGSAGVDYLDDVALKYRVFRDIWAVRTVLVRRDLLPDPEQREYYGFRSG